MCCIIHGVGAVLSVYWAVYFRAVKFAYLVVVVKFLNEGLDVGGVEETIAYGVCGIVGIGDGDFR